MQRITVTIDDELLEAVDKMIARRGYQHRSEVLGLHRQPIRGGNPLGDPTRYIANVASRPLSDACLMASTRWCNSTAVSKVGRRLSAPRIAPANCAYIWPTLRDSPDGVPGDANVKRAGNGIGARVLPPFAPCRETSPSCGDSSLE